MIKDYETMNQDIDLLTAELKIRKHMADDDIAKLLGISAGTLRNRRTDGTLASMPFCKVSELARAAGYEVKFERKGA